MGDRDNMSKQRVDKLRSRSVAEEERLEHNSFVPQLNPNSVALADLHRHRRGLANNSADEDHLGQPIYDVLHKTLTKARLSQTGATELVTTPKPVTARIAPSTQREFLLRNEKLLQTRDIHCRELRMMIDEQNTRDCTFAPSLSTTTLRLADERRSQQRREQSTASEPLDDGRQASSSPKPHRPLKQSSSTAAPVAASLEDARKFRRLDMQEASLDRKRDSLRLGSQSEDHGVYEQVDDIHDLLMQWKWLEESSRM